MFSVVVPTYNNIEYLKLCLKSLEKTQILNMNISSILMKE